MNKKLEMPVLYSYAYKEVCLEALFIIQSHLVAKENKNMVQEMKKHIKNLFTFKVSCKTILASYYCQIHTLLPVYFRHTIKMEACNAPLEGKYKYAYH